jgi:hypothetical protein
MASLISNVQERFKTSTNALMLLGFKLFTGLMIGLTLALIGMEILQYAVFSFVLVVVAATAAVMKITKPWSWTHVFIFNLICILIGLLLRMYILIAPGV